MLPRERTSLQLRLPTTCALSARETIGSLRNLVPAQFSSFFEKANFVYHAPADIVSRNDKSVRFTGSTISTFKPYLREQSIPSSGMFTVQHCLRTQNANSLHKAQQELTWGSYFLSIGAIARYEQLDSIAELTWRFFTEELLVSPEAIVVRGASKDEDLLRYWNTAGLAHRLELNTQPPAYYTHRFGMGAIVGRNCNLAIRDSETGEVRDIGNIIVIESAQKRYGVEIAFGVETVVSRLLGLKTPIQAALVADIAPTCGPAQTKLADALCAALVILNAGIRPVGTGRGRILRKYLQGLSSLRILADYSIADIANYATEFEKQAFRTTGRFGAAIAEYLSVYEKLTHKGERPEVVNRAASKTFPLQGDSL